MCAASDVRLLVGCGYDAFDLENRKVKNKAGVPVGAQEGNANSCFNERSRRSLFLV